jgi:hypothetical protein
MGNEESETPKMFHGKSFRLIDLGRMNDAIAVVALIVFFACAFYLYANDGHSPLDPLLKLLLGKNFEG